MKIRLSTPAKILLLAAVLSGAASAAPVRVVKDSAGWRLLVEGKPFFIKGVGCNSAAGDKGEDYLLMAKELGANAVRTWGGAPRSYLDKAQEYGLKMDLGIWLNPIREKTSGTYRDANYREALKKSILSYVREMRDHPALLMWNIGNEVFAYTKDPDERDAFGTFLAELIDAVHAEDPDHPIVYACAGNRDLPELKAHTPRLDIVGMNIYSALLPSVGADYDKPLLITEFGPQGGWDVGKDVNRMPFDPPDSIKAASYAEIWRHIEAERGRCLGGFAFVLGNQRNSESLTWWNINYGDFRRLAYATLYTAYTGEKLPHAPPRISEFQVEHRVVAPGELLTVRASIYNPEGGALTYAYFITGIASDPLIVDTPVFYTADPQELAPGSARLKAPLEPNIYRIYVVVTDAHRNAAIADRTFRVTVSTIPDAAR